MRNAIILTILITSLFWRYAGAQEVQFSQIERSVYGLNPAATGYDMGSYFHRMAVMTRTQWGSPWQSDAMQSFLANYDFRLCGENLAFGLQGRWDHANLANFTYSGLHVNAAYHQVLGGRTALSIGASGGMLNYSLDPTALTFNEQYDGTGFNPGLDTGEEFAYDSRFQPDLSAGLLLHGERFSAGLGLNHLSSPTFSFLGERNVLNPTITLHGSYSFRMHDGTNPPLLTIQGLYRGPFPGAANNQRILLAGGKTRFNFPGGGGFIAGAAMRVVSREASPVMLDAITPTVIFEAAPWTIGISYDANVSRLRTTFTGGLELSLAWMIGRKPSCPPMCPWEGKRH